MAQNMDQHSAYFRTDEETGEMVIFVLDQIARVQDSGRSEDLWDSIDSLLEAGDSGLQVGDSSWGEVQFDGHTWDSVDLVLR